MDNIPQTGTATRSDLFSLAYMLHMAKTAKPEAARRAFYTYAGQELWQLEYLSRGHSPGSKFAKHNIMEEAL